MAKMAICPICKQPTLVKGFNWFLFLVLGGMTGGSFMAIYLIYYFTRAKRCYNCHAKF